MMNERKIIAILTKIFFTTLLIIMMLLLVAGIDIISSPYKSASVLIAILCMDYIVFNIWDALFNDEDE
jgi:hypothetical protein